MLWVNKFSTRCELKMGFEGISCIATVPELNEISIPEVNSDNSIAIPGHISLT